MSSLPERVPKSQCHEATGEARSSCADSLSLSSLSFARFGGSLDSSLSFLSHVAARPAPAVAESARSYPGASSQLYGPIQETVAGWAPLGAVPCLVGESKSAGVLSQEGRPSDDQRLGGIPSVSAAAVCAALKVDCRVGGFGDIGLRNVRPDAADPKFQHSECEVQHSEGEVQHSNREVPRTKE